MKNEYEICGLVTKIFIESKKYGKFITTISTKEFEKVNKFPNTWGVNFSKKTKNFYVSGRISKNNKEKWCSLHGWITDVPKGMEVDHINHDTLDNTNQNLRVVTVSENQQNRKGAKKGSKSGYRGVVWHKASGTWNVQLIVNKVKMSFGYFHDVEEANRVAVEARKVHMPNAS